MADGVASAEEIDEAMKLGANHPMGPLTLGDFIGLDVCLAIMEVLFNEYGDPKYRPHVQEESSRRAFGTQKWYWLFRLPQINSN